jgi:hypothetical protein
MAARRAWWWGLALAWAGCADSTLESSAPMTPEADMEGEGDLAQEVGDALDEPPPGEDQGEEVGPGPDLPEEEPVLPVCAPSMEVCDGVDNDCNGRVDEVACACTGEAACYTGPAQTRGVGACRDGGRVCDQSGEFFQDCGGGVLPSLELCLDGIDNDCDGAVDEDPCMETCSPGDARPCYTGPQQAAGVGACAFGVQECNVEGVWNACRGAILPEPESCGDGRDNDCDYVIDTDCADNLPLREDMFTVSERSQRRPVDFVMAIDNSGSMDDTVALVEENLGELARRLVQSGIDYRFVMVTKKGTRPQNPDVCAPEPLAGPGCANNERFLHVDKEVSSSSALSDILGCHGGCDGQSYSGFLRNGSFKQLIAVTDDESGLAWSPFRDAMRPLVGDFNLNGVIGTIPGECVVRVGQQYLAGINETRGEALHICDMDWGVVIDVLFEATLAELDRVFTLTGAPVLDTLQVFVREGEGPQVEQLGNWRYNALLNLVTFLPNLGPPLGSEVLLRYRTTDQ